MEFWIKNGDLFTWLDPNRKIQETLVASNVIDGDYNDQLNEWLVVKSDGTVRTLKGHLRIEDNTYSRDGVSARWSGTDVVVRESNGRSKVYNHRGFLQREF